MTFPIPIPTRIRRTLRVFLALVLLVGSSTLGARTITVGNGGCQYIGLQFALDDLADEPGPHVIRLRTQTIAIPNGLVLNTGSTSYTFVGGHASCADSTPTAGQRTVLDATGGNDGTAFAINGPGSGAAPAVILSRLTVRGGSSETGIGANPEGGGLEIRGSVIVRLDDGTRIEDNASGKGGGAYLRGNSEASVATLWILGDSRILENTATTQGGGIYCAAFGDVLHDHGQVSYNQAESGGGAFVEDSCAYDGFVSAGMSAAIANNVAGSGGGLAHRSRRPLTLRGSPTEPFYLFGNVANGGGALSIGNNAPTRTAVLLENVVIWNNRAGTFSSGAAFTLVGGVDLTMRARNGVGRCAYFGIPLQACSAVIGNETESSLGGNMQLWLGLAGGSATVTVRRTAFVGNRARSLFTGFGPVRFDIENSLIRDNRLDPATSDYRSALFWVAPEWYGTVPAPPAQRFAFNTVVGTIPSTGSVVFDHGRSPLDVTGSIVHSPGLVARATDSSGAVSHNGCLLVHEASGFPSTPAPPLVVAPGLDANLMPVMTSPALDQCAAAQAPTVDFHGDPRAIDQVAVPNRFGPVDLGAIERPSDNDVIFRSGFE